MPRTRPEVNPKIFVPKKKLGAKGVGLPLAFRWLGGSTFLGWGGQEG